MSAIEIPVVDVRAMRSDDPDATARLATQVGEICELVGFLVITGHGVPDDLIADTYGVAADFFHLPLEEKLRYQSPSPGVYRGFMASQGSALAASRGVETPPDLVELFTTNRFDDPEVARRAGMRPGREGFFAPNVWPDQPAAFRPTIERYYAEMERLALDLMGVFALALGLDHHWFDRFFDDHITNLTINYYPPQDEPPAEGQLRRGAHSDWGSLTILYQDDAPGGLQVLTKAGEWFDVPHIPGSYIINLGDLMAFWTADRWVSNLHRVVNPPREFAHRERISIPFFHQPSFDAVITTIPGCGTAGDAESTTSGEWILDKLRKTIY